MHPLTLHHWALDKLPAGLNIVLKRNRVFTGTGTDDRIGLVIRVDPDHCHVTGHKVVTGRASGYSERVVTGLELCSCDPCHAADQPVALAAAVAGLRQLLASADIGAGDKTPAAKPATIFNLPATYAARRLYHTLAFSDPAFWGFNHPVAAERYDDGRGYLRWYQHAAARITGEILGEDLWVQEQRTQSLTRRITGRRFAMPTAPTAGTSWVLIPHIPSTRGSGVRIHNYSPGHAWHQAEDVNAWFDHDHDGAATAIAIAALHQVPVNARLTAVLIPDEARRYFGAAAVVAAQPDDNAESLAMTWKVASSFAAPTAASQAAEALRVARM